MKAFFLAAGFGTRLRPFTETDAKPAIPFLGLPQILYPYFFCKEMEVQDIVYNTHHNPDSVNKVFENFEIPAINYHEPEILNSAGGLSHARASLINESHFLLLNADSLFLYNDITPFQDTLKRHIHEDRLATLFTISKEGCGTDFPGLVSDESNTLITAGLLKDLNPELTVELNSTNQLPQFHHFIGCYIFSNRIFNLIENKPDNMIYDILLKRPEIEKNKVKTENFKNVAAYELGTIKDYKTNHLILSKLLDDNTENSLTRTHRYFKNRNPNQYPYKNKLEQQILRSL